MRPRILRAATAVLAGAAVGLLAMAAAALEGEGRRRATVEDMDLALLQQSLLKVYIIERESVINEKRLQEYKVASQVAGELGRDTLKKPTKEQLEDLKERHKAIYHYLMLEKGNAVHSIHIVDKVLGTDVHLPGEGRPERVILEKQVPKFEVARGSDLLHCFKELEKALGCPVVGELPPLQKFTISLYQENTTGEALIRTICSIHPLEWRIEEGTLYFRHMEFDPGFSDELDEEEREALEELRRKEEAEREKDG